MSRSPAIGPTVWILMILTLVSGTLAVASDQDRLIFHAETLSGKVLMSERADTPFNPASVVKVGTSLWALDRNGPAFRYETGVGYLGDWDRDRSTIVGSMVLKGGSDPDFHMDNVFWIARQLNRLGIRAVNGDLLVTGPFAMGWENGTERNPIDPERRAREMGSRFLAAVDQTRWTSAHRSAWRDVCERRGWDPEIPPSVRVSGAVRTSVQPVGCTVVLTHGSNPLAVLLRRFNVYSNNDIIRVADGLGGADALTEYLRDRLEAQPAELDLTTGSGQGRNRMTARVAVQLMREFRDDLRGMELELVDLLPVPGCDPGPTGRMFPELVAGPNAHTAVVKTGTLTTTDRGVVVLAGAFESRSHGTVLFCVAATNTGMDVARWRAVEQAWLLELIRSAGGAVAMDCGPDLPFSGSFAVIDEPAPGEKTVNCSRPDPDL